MLEVEDKLLEGGQLVCDIADVAVVGVLVVRGGGRDQGELGSEGLEVLTGF